MSKLIPIKKVNVFYDDIQSFSNATQSIDLKTNEQIKKILIIKWGGMGDVILSTAVMEDIHNSFKNADLHLNTLPQWQSIFLNDKRFTKIWGSESAKKVGSLKHLYEWIKNVKAENYDLIIDLQTNDRTRIYLSILRFIKFSPKYISGNHPVFPYSIFSHSKDKSNHPFTLLQKNIGSFGVPSKTLKPKIYYSNKDKTDALNLMKKNKLIKDKFIIFICGSSKNGVLKRWGVKNFLDLFALIKKNINLKVVLIGGKDDEDECNSISFLNKDIINFCNQTSLTALPMLFKNAKCIIGNDTGATHIAASTDVPVILITGPTNPEKVKPLGKNIIALQSEIECKNCYLKLCPHHSCMKGLLAEHVFNKIKKIL